MFLYPRFLRAPARRGGFELARYQTTTRRSEMLLPTLWLKRDYAVASVERPERCCDCCRLNGAVLVGGTLTHEAHKELMIMLAHLREADSAAPPGAAEPRDKPLLDSCLGVFGHSDAREGTKVQLAFEWLDEAVNVCDALKEREVEARVLRRVHPTDCRAP